MPPKIAACWHIFSKLAENTIPTQEQLPGHTDWGKKRYFFGENFLGDSTEGIVYRDTKDWPLYELKGINYFYCLSDWDKIELRFCFFADYGAERIFINELEKELESPNISLPSHGSNTVYATIGSYHYAIGGFADDITLLQQAIEILKSKLPNTPAMLFTEVNHFIEEKHKNYLIKRQNLLTKLMGKQKGICYVSSENYMKSRNLEKKHQE